MKPCIKMFIAAEKPIPKNTTVSTNSVEDIIVPSNKRGFSAAPSAWQSETVTFSGTVGPRICVRNDLLLADEKNVYASTGNRWWHHDMCPAKVDFIASSSPAVRLQFLCIAAVILKSPIQLTMQQRVEL